MNKQKLHFNVFIIYPLNCPFVKCATATAQRKDFGINQAPVGRDSNQGAGPYRPLSRIRARSSRRHGPPAPASWARNSDAAPVPPTAASLGAPRPSSRSAISSAAAPPPPPQHTQLSPGTGTVDGGSRAPGKLAAQWRAQFVSRRSEGASPASPGALGPARASRRLSSPGVPRRCAPLSGTSYDRVASSLPGCQGLGSGKAVSRATVGVLPPPPRTPPLAFTGSRCRSLSSPSSRSSSVGFPPPCERPESQRRPAPRAAAPNWAGAAQDAARNAGGEGVGKGGGGIRHEWARRPLPGPP